jgi:hypothetical protein
MAAINVDRYESFSARALGIKGPGALTRLEDGIFATLALDCDAPVEHWWEQRIYRFSAFCNCAAEAGKFGQIVVINPSTDSLLVVERFNIRCSSDDHISVSIQRDSGAIPTDLSGVLSRALDTRIEPESLAGFAAAGADNGGAVPTGYLETCRIPCPGATGIQYDYPCVVGPGGGLSLGVNTAAKSFTGNIEYHLRAALPGELD